MVKFKKCTHVWMPLKWKYAQHNGGPLYQNNPDYKILVQVICQKCLLKNSVDYDEI